MPTRRSRGDVAEPPSHGRRAASDSAPRGPASLEQLTAEQAVAPVSDLDELALLWPCDDDPQDLLEHILSERAARRQPAGSVVSYVDIPDETAT